MARYIDVDKINFRGIEPQMDKNYITLIPLKYAECIVNTAPTADVVEVKHGEWIEKEEIYGDVYYTCSNCNNDWTTIDGTPQENFMNFCPNCGAKMDGERK